MLVGDSASFDMIPLCYFQIEGWIEDPSYAIILCCYLSWNGLVFLLYKDRVVLLVKEQNWQWLKIAVLLIQLCDLIAAFTSKHVQIARPHNSD